MLRLLIKSTSHYILVEKQQQQQQHLVLGCVKEMNWAVLKKWIGSIKQNF